ncbi:MAG: S46 family peptidase [Ignavibacteriaceae bacterium]
MQKICNSFFSLSIFLSAVLLLTGCSSHKEITQSSYQSRENLDTVKAQRFDMGKMWTFENPPINYFKEEYNFEPDQQWLEKARKSALKFGNGCSASFISEDGLIMTNHHCIRGILNTIAEGDENFLRDGFSAKSVEEEKQVPGLFVQQLMLIKDVTDEMQNEMLKGVTNEEKVQMRDLKEQEIINRYMGINDSLVYRVISLYNGGKYSLYGYKRYDDIRFVFAPDLRSAKLGGDYDNFTYPRHGIDCAFLRAYENGKPVKSPDFFKWNEEGAKIGEPIFIIGNPGRTDRIKTLAQIEYDREYVYPAYVSYLQEVYNAYLAEVEKTNGDDYNLIARLYTIGNVLKVNKGILDGLNDPVLMARKKDFEKKFRTAVNNDEELKQKYAHLWPEIEESREASKTFAPELSAYSISTLFQSEYFNIARNIIKLAEELSLTEKSENKQQEEISDSIISKIYPGNFNSELQNKILAAQIDFYYQRLGENNPILQDFLQGRRGNDAVKYLLSNSVITTREDVAGLLVQSPEQILNSNDPFINFVLKIRQRNNELKTKNNIITAREEINNQLLGQALWEVYGESIPPDATGTLRIADGVIETYPYNGTIAPPYTTFYGMLEKYYSFNKQFPFNLPPFWENLPPEFDLSTPLNFISTNDIIGGNSGSPVVNTKLEIVGLAFDGNYDGLSDRYIYTTEANRTISVHPKGMLEAIRDLYKLTRLSNEIVNSKME